MILGECVLDYDTVCKLPFGASVQIHEDNKLMNTMVTKATRGICLGPSNMNGGFRFLAW
jgi:hypothetical protein